ncbi:hypothetical protein R3P38DRAFT_3245361 [Favolaschia claudopus]|uniref:Transmembrane protein n=1 Tax=Favolaschia claudopus TaxID=2862362 RepID=A0AAV9Z0Y6_9AGAR
MTTHAAVVDDRDPTIAYSGSWGRAGSLEEFDGTTTFSTGQGASATFPFVGTSVTVYGTIGARNITTQPTWTFTVDGSLLGTFTPTQGMTADVHHQALWTSPSLSLNDGTHNLVIQQTSATTTGVLFLDYIMFTTTSASVSAYFVDDRDTRIQYNPAWQFFGSDGDFQHTSQASRAQGDELTLQFDGKSISFYGGVTSASASASMSIDGGPPTVWVPPTTASQTNNLIFNSGDLTPGTHKLVVTANNDQPVWADYFLVTPNPPGSVQSSSSAHSSSASSSPSSIGPAPNRSSNSVNTAPIGTIVGVVVGIGLPLLLGLSLFICRWRKRRAEGRVGSGDLPQSQPPQMSTAPGAPGPSGSSGYVSATGAVASTSTGAGPPPVLSHGYSSSELGPFATPRQEYAGQPDYGYNNINNNDHNNNSYYGGGGGPSQHSDQNSTFFPASASHSSPSPSHSNSHLASPGHGQAQSFSGTLPTPSVSNSNNSNSAPSAPSEDGIVAVDRATGAPLPSAQGQGQGRGGGMIPSNKLTREMERARQWHVATAPSVSSSSSAPGATGQQRESHGAPPPVYEE